MELLIANLPSTEPNVPFVVAGLPSPELDACMLLIAPVTALTAQLVSGPSSKET